MMVHNIDPVTHEQRQVASLEFEAGLGYVVRPGQLGLHSEWNCLKKGQDPPLPHPEGQFFNCCLHTHFHLSAQQFLEASI